MRDIDINIKIIAVELSIFNYGKCKWNIIHNNLDSIVKIKQFALSDKNKKLFFDVKGIGDQHKLIDKNEIKSRENEMMEVKCRTIDNMLCNISSKHDIILYKIDTEVQEYIIIKSAKKILYDFKDKSIFVIENIGEHRIKILQLRKITI